MRHWHAVVVALVMTSGRSLAQEPGATPPTGAILGHVSGDNGERLVHVNVVLDTAGRHIPTDDTGHFSFYGLAPRSYWVIVRAPGYVADSILVAAENGVVVDTALYLTKIVAIERVVVTGRIATSERETPTPITSITSTQIDEQDIRSIDQLIPLLPSAVSFSSGTSANLSAVSIRGTSSLLFATTETLINGVPVAQLELAHVDRSSIASVDELRGPAVTTSYGSQTTGGVIQAFTKLGDTVATRPTVSLSADGSLIQRPNTANGAGEQHYEATVDGGLKALGYDLGGSLDRIGPWLPGYFANTGSGYGGMLFHVRTLRVSGFGRYWETESALINSPALAVTGVPQEIAPEHVLVDDREHTFGTHVDFVPWSWNTNDLIVGVDASRYGYHSTKPQLLTPAESLFVDYYSTSTRTSVFYTTSAKKQWPGISLTTIGGIDHSSQSIDQYSGAGAVDHTTNALTGYLLRETVGIQDQLFVTGSVRTEHGTTFPPHTGTPVLPEVGVAYTQPFGAISVKARVEYGQAVRPPESTEITGDSSATILTVRPNRSLRAERQEGGDAGFDVRFGTVASIGVTYYRQRAADLIDEVIVLPYYQYQNVADVLNRGLEIEGTVTTPRISANGQFSLMRSTVSRVDPGSTDDWRVGDELLMVPAATAGVAVTARVTRRTSITVGVIYVGRFKNLNAIALLDSANAGASPALPERIYWEMFPGSLTGQVKVEQQIGHGASAYVKVEDIANAHSNEANQYIALPGRIIRLGIRLRATP